MKFPQRYSLGTYLHGSIAFLNRYDVMTERQRQNDHSFIVVTTLLALRLQNSSNEV